MDGSDLYVRAVGHDFGDLHRWLTIINRFARSDGNAIGILGVEILPIDVPVSRGKIARTVEPAGYWNQLTLRVETIDLGSTVDTLPLLLPQLGIPVDAVGLV